MRLKVKQQIEEFNKLLVQQAHLMHDLNSTGVAPMPTSNGFHISPCKTAFLPHEHFTVWSVGIDSSKNIVIHNSLHNWDSSLQLCFVIIMIWFQNHYITNVKTVWLERKQTSISERLKERRNCGLLWGFVLISKFMICIFQSFQSNSIYSNINI